ncbi:restriction endonuclease [Microbacterium resistens]|uniref:restriction endonuclease n=1 Tax=Microbacterium resistens TaxID=156977 RepID=UPI001C55F59C|nr:restriction endonuclease [Microbacterium resistens]MBW1639564.1 restriction endonuclease [Microbacterium resistens]
MDEELAQHMQPAAGYGKWCAQHVENVWQPNDDLVTLFRSWGREWASANIRLASHGARRGMWAVVVARVLLGVWIGAFVLGVFLVMPSPALASFFIGLAVVAFVVWLMARGERLWRIEKYSEQYDADLELVEGWVVAGAMAEVERLRQSARDHRATGEGAFQVPPPAPQPYGVSDRGAEEFVAGWMRHLGESDATVTQYTNDGGIDVTSRNYIAQVKNYRGSVPVAEIRDMVGVASLGPRKALFFTSGTYPSGAVEFAEKAGMALFIYDATAGTLRGANALGEEYMRTGL